MNARAKARTEGKPRVRTEEEGIRKVLRISARVYAARNATTNAKLARREDMSKLLFLRFEILLSMRARYHLARHTLNHFDARPF